MNLSTVFAGWSAEPIVGSSAWAPGPLTGGSSGGPSAGSALVVASLAAAAWWWPSAPRVRPGSRAGRGRSALPRASWGRLAGALLAAAALVTAAASAGAAGVLAAAMLGATGVLLGRRLLAQRHRRRALPEILRGLRALNRELRAGADPLTAVGGAGAACRGAGERVLARLAVLMQSGSDGDPNADEPAVGVAEPEDRVLDVLRSGWLLSRRHGVAFGRVVSGIADELSDEVAAEQERAAQLAGPRMSGYVLAALPLMGLLLGAGMGVNPLGVLLGSAAGHALLVIGVALMCAGLLWSARIVGR